MPFFHQSCTNGSATADCTCLAHANSADRQDEHDAGFQDGEIEEEPPNYKSLRQAPTESSDPEEQSCMSDEDEKKEDVQSFLDRPPETIEELDKQLDLLYAKQRERERKTVDPDCDCEYCVELRAYTPSHVEDGPVVRDFHDGIAGERIEEGDKEGPEVGREPEESGLSESDFDETNLTKHERRARDKRMYSVAFYLWQLAECTPFSDCSDSNFGDLFCIIQVGMLCRPYAPSDMQDAKL